MKTKHPSLVLHLLTFHIFAHCIVAADGSSADDTNGYRRIILTSTILFVSGCIALFFSLYVCVQEYRRFKDDETIKRRFLSTVPSRLKIHMDDEDNDVSTLGSGDENLTVTTADIAQLFVAGSASTCTDSRNIRKVGPFKNNSNPEHSRWSYFQHVVTKLKEKRDEKRQMRRAASEASKDAYVAYGDATFDTAKSAMRIINDNNLNDNEDVSNSYYEIEDSPWQKVDTKKKSLCDSMIASDDSPVPKQHLPTTTASDRSREEDNIARCNIESIETSPTIILDHSMLSKVSEALRDGFLADAIHHRRVTEKKIDAEDSFEERETSNRDLSCAVVISDITSNRIVGIDNSNDHQMKLATGNTSQQTTSSRLSSYDYGFTEYKSMSKTPSVSKDSPEEEFVVEHGSNSVIKQQQIQRMPHQQQERPQKQCIGQNFYTNASHGIIRPPSLAGSWASSEITTVSGRMNASNQNDDDDGVSGITTGFSSMDTGMDNSVTNRSGITANGGIVAENDNSNWADERDDVITKAATRGRRLWDLDESYAGSFASESRREGANEKATRKPAQSISNAMATSKHHDCENIATHETKSGDQGTGQIMILSNGKFNNIPRQPQEQLHKYKKQTRGLICFLRKKYMPK